MATLVAESPGTHQLKRPCPAEHGARAPSTATLQFCVLLTQKEPSPRLLTGLAPRVAVRVTKAAKKSPAPPCHPCLSPAPASRSAVAHWEAVEGWPEERGHPLASSRHPRRQNPPAIPAAPAVPRTEPHGAVPGVGVPHWEPRPAWFFFWPGGVGSFLLYYFSNNPSSKEDLWRSSASPQNHQ